MHCGQFILPLIQGKFTLPPRVTSPLAPADLSCNSFGKQNRVAEFPCHAVDSGHFSSLFKAFSQSVMDLGFIVPSPYSNGENTLARQQQFAMNGEAVSNNIRSLAGLSSTNG
jgi:hypothetical protein